MYDMPRTNSIHGSTQACFNANHLCFTFLKLDQDTGEGIENAIFSLRESRQETEQHAASNHQGTVTFVVMRCNVYTLKEITPAEGYALNARQYNVYIDASGCVFVDGKPQVRFAVYNQLMPQLRTVTYNANGGTGQFIDSGISPNTIYTIRSEEDTGIHNLGFALVSWNTMQNGSGSTYLPGEPITITEDLILYAQWILLS